MHFISVLLKKRYDCKAYILTVFCGYSIAKEKGIHFIYLNGLFGVTDCPPIGRQPCGHEFVFFVILITCHHDHLRSITRMYGILFHNTSTFFALCCKTVVIEQCCPTRLHPHTLGSTPVDWAMAVYRLHGPPKPALVACAYYSLLEYFYLYMHLFINEIIIYASIYFYFV